jgi:hypothetical protein
MTIAELHGKSPWTTSEDFLTADVFAAFRYLPAEPGLVSFLRSVPGLGERLPVAREVEARLHFWPLGMFLKREPDLLLELRLDGRLVHVVVESKYSAGPSDKTGSELLLGDQMLSIGRQLVDQFLDLKAGYYTVFYEGLRDRQIVLDSMPGERYLLYLTAHAVRPEAELDPSFGDHEEIRNALLWTNWHHVYDHLHSLRFYLTDFPYASILADICLLLKRKGFFTFHGFSPSFPITSTDSKRIFWLDTRPGENVFSGFGPPPRLEPIPPAGAFWRAHRTG